MKWEYHRYTTHLFMYCGLLEGDTNHKLRLFLFFTPHQSITLGPILFLLNMQDLKEHWSQKESLNMASHIMVSTREREMSRLPTCGAGVSGSTEPVWALGCFLSEEEEKPPPSGVVMMIALQRAAVSFMSNENRNCTRTLGLEESYHTRLDLSANSWIVKWPCLRRGWQFRRPEGANW